MMALLHDELKQNITDIVWQIRYLQLLLSRTKSLSPEQNSKISFACTEIALLAIAASDDISKEGTIGDRLLQQEISSALWQIALHCIEIQEWTGEEMIRSNIKMIGKHCTGIIRMLSLPEPQFDEALILRATDDMVPFPAAPMQTIKPPGKLSFKSNQFSSLTVQDIPAEEESPETASLITAPPAEDEIEKLKREIIVLREILSSLVLKRDNLLLVESKELEALYMKELGNLQAEIYEAESNARYLLRKYQMMQASVNRQEEFDTRKIEEDLKEIYEAYKKVYEDFVRKAREASETVKKRREKAKSTAEGLGKEKTETQTEEQDELPGKAEEKDEDVDSEERRLKKLYRKIVKAMHPDLHPEQDEKTKELFKRAIRAYEEGDLQTLEEIDQIIGGGAPENTGDILQSLLEEKDRLIALIQGIRAQISLILNRYPFTKKELLNNPVRLEAEKNKLRKRLEQAKQRAASYQALIDEMEKQQYGRSHSES